MTGTTPEQFMATWIKQTNYPEVAVVLATNAQSNSRVYFVQKRFLMSQDVLPDIDFPSPFGFVSAFDLNPLRKKTNLYNLNIFFQVQMANLLKVSCWRNFPE